MFSGIVEAVGRIGAIEPATDGARIRVDVAPGFGLDDVRIGDSIAVSGCCLTVVENGGLSRRPARPPRPPAATRCAAR